MNAIDTSFPRAVLRRLNPRALLLAGITILALSILGSLGLVMSILTTGWEAQAARLLETVSVGAAIFIAVQIADEAVDRGAPRWSSYALAVLTGACVGALAGFALRELVGLRYGGLYNHRLTPRFPVAHRIDLALIGVLIGGLATAVHVRQRAAMAARRRLHAAEQRRIEARRRTIESELQALQARVEPAFLFDSLRRIRALYDSDVAAASRMLEDLIVYLRAALPHMRESTSTLRQELTLATSWLDIVRRGTSTEGASIDVEADDTALDARLPAVVLLPLVQHAAGGRGPGIARLALASRVEGGRLHIELWSSDDAFAPPHFEAALAPVRERLHALYGDDAGALGSAGPSAGSVVRVWLPGQAGGTPPDPGARS